MRRLSALIRRAHAFVNLDQHGVIDGGAEDLFDCRDVRAMPIGGQLNPALQPRSQITDEGFRILDITSPTSQEIASLVSASIAVQVKV